MNNAVERHNNKSGVLVNITLSVATSDSEPEVIIGNEFMTKIKIEIPNRKTIRYFRIIGEFSFF